MAPDSRRKKSGLPSEKTFDDALFVHSFSKLCEALRAKEDFPATAKSILNERLLSKVVFQIQYFMETAFGKGSALSVRTVTKLPSDIFRDFSPKGSLFTVLDIAINYQYSHGWETFDLGTSDRYQNGVEIVQQIESKLIKNGQLRRPKVFLSSVPDGKLEDLRRIVTSHGGVIAGTAAEASHIVDWDEEVDSMPADLTEEFVRTLEVRRNPLAAAGSSAAAAVPPARSDVDASAATGDRIKPITGTALVHWWYHPDSYDEWIPADNIDDSEMPDTIPRSSNRPIDTKWHVCCRYLYDCEVFNEWGNEVDYEIPEQTDGGDDDDAATTAEGGGGGSAAKTRGKSRGKKRVDQTKLKKEAPIVEAIASTEKMLQDAAPPTSDVSVPLVEIVDLQTSGEHLMSKIENEIAESVEALEDSSSSMMMDIDITTNTGGSSSTILVKTEGGSSDTATAGGVSVKVETGDVKVGSKRKAGQITDDDSTPELSSAATQSDDNIAAENAARAAAAIALPAVTLPDSILHRLPVWLKLESVSDFEVKYLPELFAHPSFITSTYSRTPEDYVKIRNFILILYAQNPTAYLSATDCRRKIAGDVCVTVKIHNFLDSFGAINFDVKPENRPSVPASGLFSKRFLPAEVLATGVPSAAISAPSNKDQAVSRAIFGSPIDWTDALDHALLRLVAETDGSDWEAVAVRLAKEFPNISPRPTSAECLARFVSIPLAPPSSSSFSSSFAAAAALSSSSAESLIDAVGVLSANPDDLQTPSSVAVLGHLPAALQGAYGIHTGEHPDKQLKLVAYQLLQNAVAALGHHKTSEVVKSVLSFMKEKHPEESSEAARSLAVGVAVLSSVASEEAKTEEGRVKDLLGEYVRNRLRALEEKMKLIGEVDNIIDLERERLEIDRRDVQIQRAQLAFQSQSLSR